MSLLNPIVSKAILSAGTTQEVYMCPAGKTHAYVDLSFFRDDTNTSSMIAIGLSTLSNPASLTTLDFFIDDIELINEVNTAEMSKVIVGSGERLFVKVISGTQVAVRVSGVEENSTKVMKAGRLAASTVPGTAQTKILDATTYTGASYVSASITIFNTSTTNNAKVEMWVTSSETDPGNADKNMLITIPIEDTTIVENILLLPNEKVFVRSDVAGIEYFINGTVISQ